MSEILGKNTQYEAPNAVDGSENQETGTDRQKNVPSEAPIPFTSPEHDVSVEKTQPLPCDTLPSQDPLFERQFEFAEIPAEGNAWQRYIAGITDHDLVTPQAIENRLKAEEFISRIKDQGLPVSAHIGGTTANGLAGADSDIDITFVTDDNHALIELNSQIQSLPSGLFRDTIFDISSVYIPDLVTYPTRILQQYDEKDARLLITTNLNVWNPYLLRPTLEELKGTPLEQVDINNRAALFRQMQSLPPSFQSNFWQRFSQECNNMLKGTEKEDDTIIHSYWRRKVDRGLAAFDKRLCESGIPDDIRQGKLLEANQRYRSLQLPNLPLLAELFIHSADTAALKEMEQKPHIYENPTIQLYAPVNTEYIKAKQEVAVERLRQVVEGQS